jgi:hypothetical protein
VRGKQRSCVVGAREVGRRTVASPGGQVSAHVRCRALDMESGPGERVGSRSRRARHVAARTGRSCRSARRLPRTSRRSGLGGQPAPESHRACSPGAREFGWSVVAYQSPDHLGLITLSGIVVDPRLSRDWRGKPLGEGSRPRPRRGLGRRCRRRRARAASLSSWPGGWWLRAGREAVTSRSVRAQ